MTAGRWQWLVFFGLLFALAAVVVAAAAASGVERISGMNGETCECGKPAVTTPWARRAVGPGGCSGSAGGRARVAGRRGPAFWAAGARRH